MGALFGGIAGAIGPGVFEGMGGVVSDGFAWSNFLPAVKAGAVVGAALGGLSTAIGGGNFFQNVAFGALGGGITAAGTFGVLKGWQEFEAGSPTNGHEQSTKLPPRAATSANRPDLEAIANNPKIALEIEKSWNASNPHGPTNMKSEPGFWIIREATSNDLSVQHYPSFGMGDRTAPGPTPKGAIATFHPHPFTAQEGYLPGPSPADISFATNRGFPGIIRSHTGMYYHGPRLSY
jgi:hypothetical protein